MHPIWTNKGSVQATSKTKNNILGRNNKSRSSAVRNFQLHQNTICFGWDMNLFSGQHFTYSWIMVICKTFFISKPFLLKNLRRVLCHLFISIFENLFRWCLIVQNNENMHLWNICEKCEIYMEIFVWNMFKVNTKGTRMTWVIMLWCLYHQLQRGGYCGPSSTSAMKFFVKYFSEKS